MQAFLAKSMVLIALGAAVTACGSHDTVNSLTSFCDAKVKLQKVQQTGTVGEFGPALKDFADQLPDNATTAVSTTAKAMATSWDALYKTYKDTGGDPDVKLVVDGTQSPDIAGMRAEWTKELNRTKVKTVYAFANKECTRDGVS